MEGDEAQEWTGPVVVRVLSMVVPLGMLLVAFVQSTVISLAAVHLCRWPATISCDRGVPFMWPALSVAGWVLAGVAIVDWALFAIRGRADSGDRLVAWLFWGPYVALCTILAIDGRKIDGLDIALGMTVVISALLILARTIAGWTGLSYRSVLVVLSPLLVAAALAPLWAPAAFTAADRAEQRARVTPSEDFQLDDSHIIPPDPPLS